MGAWHMHVNLHYRPTQNIFMLNLNVGDLVLDISNETRTTIIDFSLLQLLIS